VCDCAGDVGVWDLVKTHASIAGEELQDLGLGMGTTIGEKSRSRADQTKCNSCK
jgi:hypothetical protein